MSLVAWPIVWVDSLNAVHAVSRHAPVMHVNTELIDGLILPTCLISRVEYGRGAQWPVMSLHLRGKVYRYFLE